MSKLRIAHVIVQPVLVHDDGIELLPGPVLEAQAITLSQFESYALRLSEFVNEQNDGETRGPSASQ